MKEIGLIKDQFASKGYTLISETYINGKEPLMYICNKHKNEGIQMIKYDYFNRTNRSQGCKYCSKESRKEKLKLSFSEVEDLFKEKNYKLISNECDYISARDNNLLYICPIHPNNINKTSYSNLKQGCGCKLCKNDTSSKIRKGSGNSNWQGGISQLNHHLRKIISPWVSDSMKQCNFSCIITGEKTKWHVHHITSFNTIVAETLEYLNLPIKPIVGDYTEQEITLINNKCLQLHYHYGLGVCVREDLHTLFHCHYGYGNNTPEQWHSFVVRWEAGEFNECT